MRIQLLTALLCLPLVSFAADEAAPTLSVKRLTLDAAGKAAWAAIETCRNKGIQVGVTVVDRNGITQVTLRDTLAPAITLTISEGKAKAAVYFGVSTAQLKDRANTPVGRTPGVVMSTGGLPIEAAGSLLGAVAVSGAPSGEIDEECAQGGIEAIIDDLEMAM
jgi:uncharacterized protein GlcG (DUF336 family)